MAKSLNITFFALFLFVISGETAAQNESDVFSGSWIYFSNAPNSLYNHLSGQAFGLLNLRREAVSRLNSPDDWKQWQHKVRETLSEIVVPFPEKTSLNARITSTIKKEGFRIENIIFESQPGFYVTSSLFIPAGIKKGGKAPAIIYCSGHTVEGYRSAVYMHVILNLVRKGFIVFAFDPAGQGERLEYYDPDSGKSLAGGPTKEHSIPGAQAFISGSSQARYMIWDGIRAVDYLFTRKEVDTGRIGITGRSGGGTQSAYIAAMDDRIYAAAPENYITNFTRLLQTIGPQDAEQNFLRGIKRGIDHADLLLVRAPKPALMITTTRDMFSIQGARETEEEVSRIYKAYGMTDNFSRMEDDAGHESTRKNREAMYAFFRKHLNNPGSCVDEEVEKLTADELKVTESGQVSVSLGSESVFSLNRKENDGIIKKWKDDRSDLTRHLSAVKEAAAKLSGYKEPTSAEIPVFCGRIQRDGYFLEKYYIKGEGEYVIPYLLLIPDRPNHKALIYLHPEGKSAAAGKGGEAEKLVKQGFTLLIPDLIGTGETGPGSFKGDAFIDGTSHNVWYASLQIGRSIVGIRAGDVSRLHLLLKKILPDYPVFGIAFREMAPVILHAAAFHPDISGVALFEPFSSYQSVVESRFYRSSFIPATVPGALTAYDLPDLAACIAPRKLLMAGIMDGTGVNLTTDAIDREYEVTKRAFEKVHANEKLKILPGIDTYNIPEEILKFMD